MGGAGSKEEKRNSSGIHRQWSKSGLYSGPQRALKGLSGNMTKTALHSRNVLEAAR